MVLNPAGLDTTTESLTASLSENPVSKGFFLYCAHTILII